MADGGLTLVCTEPHCVPTDWQMVRLEDLPGDRVRDLMTTGVVTVAADTPVGDAARRMLDRGVHRLVVTDPGGRPIGLLSATDILAALVFAAALAEGDRE
jgi:CBS domain-containing protein